MLYHGTSHLIAEKIEKDGFCVPILDILQVERNKKYWNRSIGSLGYGLYTFLNDPALAYQFALKVDSKSPIVFELPDVIPENKLLDLTDEHTNQLFREFCESNSKHGERIYKYVRKSRKVKSYAGIMIELYILFLERRYHVEILGVKRWTETDLPNIKYGIGANGIEVTIRDFSLIDMDKVKILRKEDFYGSKQD
ncbi:hypothetical protein EFS28_03470 [Lactobacillus acidophilus]|uniref:hypothetical protein n=1 Tax=Lactobacillus acidophilus TaxID=1579 RepID=UPI0021A45E23|nr:hypothetical protein [Lactobacillus acidophilus]MCT3602850.1 hypothetical protein [Lactobacillus acidophilus]MCT3623310.1 hypothetical protein [Lactobacillus acidophilus]